MTARADRVCRVDEDWDRTNASDRVSRYGAYLRSHAELFDPWRDAPGGITEDPGEFAIAALQVATGPIMSPGYVRWHARVLDYKLDRGLDPRPGGKIRLPKCARRESGGAGAGRPDQPDRRAGTGQAGGR